MTVKGEFLKPQVVHGEQIPGQNNAKLQHGYDNQQPTRKTMLMPDNKVFKPVELEKLLSSALFEASFMNAS